MAANYTEKVTSLGNDGFKMLYLFVRGYHHITTVRICRIYVEMNFAFFAHLFVSQILLLDELTLHHEMMSQFYAKPFNLQLARIKEES